MFMGLYAVSCCIAAKQIGNTSGRVAAPSGGHRPIQEIRFMTMKPKTIESVVSAEETVANAASKGFETTVSGLKDGMSEAVAGFTETQAKVKQGMEKAMKTAEELVAFSQGNVEAMVRSSQIWTAGLQEISKLIHANAQ